MNHARNSLLLTLALIPIAACGGGGGSGSTGPNVGPLFDGYGTSALSLPILVDAGTFSPVNPDTTITQYTIAPALPAGLTLDAITGVITGTPTELATTKNYKVTATNGALVDVENLTIEVRGPQAGLSSDMALVRSALIAGLPANPAAGGTSVIAAAPALATPAITKSNLANAVTTVANATLDAVTVDATVPPGDQDTTTDFTATISVDLGELSADPWTLAMKAPYDDDGLTPAAPSFSVDTSVVPIEDSELIVQTELATPALGPFDSDGIRTAALTTQPITAAFDDAEVNWTEIGGKFYFSGTLGVDAKLYRFDPAAIGGAALDQMTDVHPGLTDGAQVVTSVGNLLILSMLDGSGFTRTYAFDTVNQTLREVSALNPGGDLALNERVALGGSLYFTSLETAPQGMVLRWTAPSGANAASLTRVSSTKSAPATDELAEGLTAFGSQLCFLSVDEVQGVKNLYRFNPANNVQQQLTQNVDVLEIAVVDGELFARIDNGTDTLLYRWFETNHTFIAVDDTKFPTRLWPNLTNGMHFSAVDATSGVEKLYRYDPATVPPTLTQVSNTAGDTGSDNVAEAVQTGSLLVFASDTPSGDRKLFVYDYDTMTQRQVVDVNGTGATDNPCDMTLEPSGRIVMALESQAAGGFAVYEFDPTVGVCYMVADPFGPANDDDVFILSTSGNRTYFTARSTDITFFSID